MNDSTYQIPTPMKLTQQACQLSSMDTNVKKVELCKGMTTSCSTSNRVVSPSLEQATHNLGINQFGNNFKSRTSNLDENLCTSSHDLFDNQAIIFCFKRSIFQN
jgi:septation ring formation regulator EzrA